MDTPQTSQNTDKPSPDVPDPSALASPPPSPTTLSPPPPSLFLRLSPELRNQIYHHIYTSSVLKLSTDNPGLPLACKQIYHETIDLLYASTAFYIEDWSTLLRWLKNIPPLRRCLITEIWCGADMALSDDPQENVNCHGVLRRMARRLENLKLGLGGQDVLRSGTRVDEKVNAWKFNVWSSDPVLVWLVVNRVRCEWAVSTMPTSFESLWRNCHGRADKWVFDSIDANRINSGSCPRRMQ